MPTYGYRLVWAVLRQETELDGLVVVNAKLVHLIMRIHNLLLERKLTAPAISWPIRYTL
ncbi:IS3 family transposase [Klebsiella variicola]